MTVFIHAIFSTFKLVQNLLVPNAFFGAVFANICSLYNAVVMNAKFSLLSFC